MLLTSKKEDVNELESEMENEWVYPEGNKKEKGKNKKEDEKVGSSK
jgi:hypothetical protein